MQEFLDDAVHRQLHLRASRLVEVDAAVEAAQLGGDDVGGVGAERRDGRGDALGGPGAMIVLSHVMVWIVSHLQAMPLVYVGAMWLTYFLCFLMILRTGAQLGMLIIIIAVLVSVMGLNSIAAAEAMRDGFT